MSCQDLCTALFQTAEAVEIVIAILKKEDISEEMQQKRPGELLVSHNCCGKFLIEIRDDKYEARASLVKAKSFV